MRQQQYLLHSVGEIRGNTNVFKLHRHMPSEFAGKYDIAGHRYSGLLMLASRRMAIVAAQSLEQNEVINSISIM